ncbi:MAG: DUF92 domain-containing protein [Saprospiraceae bacterium]
MTTDLLILVYLAIFVLILTLCAEMLSRRAVLPQWLSRKILHVGAVGACAVAPVLIENLILLTWIIFLVEPLLLYLVASRRLFSESNGRRSWGIALFPLAYLVLLIIFRDQREFIIIPMAILAGSDAAAAIIGQLYAKKYYTLTGDRKSFIGSITFAGSVPLIYILISSIFPTFFIKTDLPNVIFWLGLMGIALILATLEALGSNGFDNIWVPLGAALLLQQLSIQVNNAIIIALWVGILLAILFCLYTIRKKALTLDGAIMASLLGLWVLWFAGAQWLLPLFFFFITSTFIGRWSKNRTQVTDVKHGKARDYVQVLCNGGIYGVLATFVKIGDQNIILTLMLISMAVCTADTWSSEIGIYFRWKTYDIVKMRPVPPGLSGGVSVPGTLGGFFGALAMGILGSFLLHNNVKTALILFITAAGFAGMLLDSIMGASVQARYKNLETNEMSDNKDANMILQNGWRWMTNDAVNVWSNVLIVVIMSLLLYIFF